MFLFTFDCYLYEFEQAAKGSNYLNLCMLYTTISDNDVNVNDIDTS